MTNEETGQTIIMGMGELHLEILRDRMFREFAVEANVGKPEVSYKETITMPSNSETKYVKQTGGRGQYAHVCVEIEPNEPGKGNEVVSKIVAGSFRKSTLLRVSNGIEEGLQTGVLAGYPLIDTKLRSPTVPTTKSIPMRWPLRFVLRWRSKMRPGKQRRSFLNRL